MKNIANLFIQAIGNPARGDDALAIHFLNLIRATFPKTQGQWDYQLNIEHAEFFSHQKTLVLVDASKNFSSPYTFSPIIPAQSTSFTTHTITLENILALSLELYGHAPKTFLLAIGGEYFGLTELLSSTAKTNLQLAWDFFQRNYSYCESSP